MIKNQGMFAQNHNFDTLCISESFTVIYDTNMHLLDSIKTLQ